MTEATEAKTFSSKISKLGDELAALTLKDAVDLGEYLKETYGIEPAAGGAVMMAGPAAGGAPAAAEKTSFDVILTEAGNTKIQVIKVVREVTALGLAEAKGLVDGAPKAVKTDLSKEDAEALKKKLEEAGGKVELK